MKSEYQIWQAELARPKLTIAQRMAAWFDRPAREPAASEPHPDPYRWWSAEELITAAQSSEQPQ